MPDTHLILHVKGTEKETTTLPKTVVRAAIQQGQITHSQLIWSPREHSWKQVREMPHLLPSQQLAPAPTLRPQATPQTPMAATVPQAQGGVPRVSVKAQGGTPKPAMKATARVRVGTVQGDPSKKTQQLQDPKEHKTPINPMKWICIVLGGLIVLALSVNYFLVDQPLVSRMGKTSYSSVPVYAHLGGFMEPHVLLIHIPVTSTVTKENLVDFLVVLARNTPSAPMGNTPYEHVDLTPGWTGRYSFTGEDWKSLGQMGSFSEEAKKSFLLEKLSDASGDPQITAKSSWSDLAKQQEKDKVWAAFSYLFTET